MGVSVSQGVVELRSPLCPGLSGQAWASEPGQADRGSPEDLPLAEGLSSQVPLQLHKG